MSEDQPFSQPRSTEGIGDAHTNLGEPAELGVPAIGTAEAPASYPADGAGAAQNEETLNHPEQQRIRELERELAAMRSRAEIAEEGLASVEKRLADTETYIYDLQLAIMVAEIAAEEQVAEADQRVIETREELEAYVRELLIAEERVEELRIASETDDLTGVSNRKALDAALPRAEADPEQEIISFDANGFGKVNKIQEWGPAEGDIQIRRVANAIRIAARGYGVNPRNVFRRGGDEFVVIVPKGEVEYITRNTDGQRTNEGRISVADAIIRRAAELYRHRRYSGTYGSQLEPLQTVISLSGASGATFEEADSQLQTAKMVKKARLNEELGIVGEIS